MKKRIITLLAIAILSEIVAITGLILLFSFIFKNNTSSDTVNTFQAQARYNMPGSAEASKRSANSYKYKDEYNIKAQVVFSGETITIQEELYIDKAYENGLILLYVPSMNMVKTTIKDVKIIFNESAAAAEAVDDWEIISDMVLKISIKDKYRKEKDIFVNIEYEITPGNNSGTILYSGDQVYLANFLVTPAVYKNGEPILIYKSNFGDPYIYDVNNYKISFVQNDNIYFDVYAPGEKQVLEEKVVFTAKNIRDFSAVVIKNKDSNDNKVHIDSETIYNTKVYYINSSEAAQYVKEAFLFAINNIGPYPHKEFFVVRAPLQNLEGMELSNMIFISDRCFGNNYKESLPRLIYHEVLHQWFYNIIGTDQVNEPFLDEGLVSYLARILEGSKFGNNYSYNDKFTKMDLKSYSTRDEYYRLAYTEATKYFADVHSKLGNDFYNLLKKIYEDKKYSILYFDDFAGYLSSFGGR